MSRYAYRDFCTGKCALSTSGGIGHGLDVRMERCIHGSVH